MSSENGGNRILGKIRGTVAVGDGELVACGAPAMRAEKFSSNKVMIDSILGAMRSILILAHQFCQRWTVDLLLIL